MTQIRDTYFYWPYLLVVFSFQLSANVSAKDNFPAKHKAGTIESLAPVHVNLLLMRLLHAGAAGLVAAGAAARWMLPLPPPPPRLSPTPPSPS